MNQRRNFYEDYSPDHKNSNKPFKIFFAILMVMIITVVIIAGIYVVKNYDFYSLILSFLPQNSATVVSNVVPDEEPDVQVTETLENKGLEELNQKFVNDFKAKYPSAELSFLIKNIDTGATTVYNEKKMNSASVIKLFIMETIFDKVADGSYQLTDEKKIVLSKMITESDNKASNLFIDDFGGVNENRKVDADNVITGNILNRGYKQTELNRKMHDTLPPGGSTGYENYTSVTDVCMLLEGIYNKSQFSEPYNTYALDLLKNQQRTSKIPAKIKEKYPDVTVANKTGELSQVENDVALIMNEKFNLVFVVMTGEIPKTSNGDTDYDLKEQVCGTIADMGLELVEFYKTNDFELER